MSTVLLTGLGEFKFDFNYNTPGLNSWSGDTLALCGIWQLPKVAPRSLSPVYSGNFCLTVGTG